MTRQNLIFNGEAVPIAVPTFNGQTLPTPAPLPISDPVSAPVEWKGKELLEASIEDYVTKLAKVPAICGTAEQQQTLMALIVEGNQFIKLAESERKKITSMLDAQKKDWMRLERNLIAPLLSAQARMRQVVEQYNNEQVRIRRQREEEARAEQEREIRENGVSDWLAPKLPTIANPKGVRMVWTYEITMPKVVPREYLTIDDKAIKAAIASGVREIDGIRIYQEPQTSYRS